MQRPSHWYSAAFAEREPPGARGGEVRAALRTGDRVTILLPALVILVITALFAGCTAPPPGETPSWSVGPDGDLTLTCPEPPSSVTELNRTANWTASRVVFSTISGPVYGLLVTPAHPRAAFVHAPGVGVIKERHFPRAVQYADAGYACLVLDIRGQGGETSGYPLDFEKDYALFARDKWPQVYLIVCDLIGARKFLTRTTGVPVIASGESNGGRYAALAAAADPGFAGYIGISTSGFNRTGDRYPGNLRRFLLSIDPDVAVGSISPRPVWVFHAPADTIIPYADGQALWSHAGEPRRFTAFNGTHGAEQEVDSAILADCTWFYAPAG